MTDDDTNDSPEAPDTQDANGKLRIDRWLWFARFFKTRSIASRLSARRKVRVDGTIVSKASHTVSVGNVLTFPQGRIIRTVRILALGDHRGPAPEAQALYDDLAPPEDNLPLSKRRGPMEGAPALRDPGAGRPTKADRRAMDKFLSDDD